MVRDSVDIVADLVRGARRVTAKTPLFHEANLNAVRGNEYLAICVDAGLIDETIHGRYVATDRGEEYVARLAELRSMLPTL